MKVFSESLESTLSGRGFFFNTNEWEDLGAWSHFGAHNSPILFLLLIPYALYPSVHTLLVIQALAVAFAAIILYKLAFEVLQDEKKALIVSIAYLLNPLTHGIIRYEFHPAVLGVPFMFSFAYYMEKKDFRKAIIAALFILSVKEDAGLFLIVYALFEVLKKHGFRVKEWFGERQAIGFGALGAFWILVSIFIVIPHFNISHSYPYFRRVYLSENFNRVAILAMAMAKLVVLLLSTGFILLRKYEYWAPIVFLWMENAISGRISQAVIGFQYDYMLLSMAFITLVYALNEWKGDNNWLFGLSVLSMLIFSPIFGVLNLFPLVAGERFWVVLKIVRG